MRTYCTQNNGKCNTCSLTNYGRDCQNNPIKSEHPDIFHTTAEEKKAAKECRKKAINMVSKVNEGYLVAGENVPYKWHEDAISHAMDVIDDRSELSD